MPCTLNPLSTPTKSIVVNSVNSTFKKENFNCFEDKKNKVVEETGLISSTLLTQQINCTASFNSSTKNSDLLNLTASSNCTVVSSIQEDLLLENSSEKFSSPPNLIEKANTVADLKENNNLNKSVLSKNAFLNQTKSSVVKKPLNVTLTLCAASAYKLKRLALHNPRLLHKLGLFKLLLNFLFFLI